jgi:hypothetical protein
MKVLKRDGYNCRVLYRYLRCSSLSVFMEKVEIGTGLVTNFKHYVIA